MTDPNTVADTYLATWNSHDPELRRKLIENAWSLAASYVDPLMSGNGREAISTMIAAAREHFPGHIFSLRGAPDGHGEHVRFSWTLTSPDGVAVGGGTDVATLDETGRIDRVIGFLDGGVA